MSSPNPGKAVFDTVVTVGSLGFVPVAHRFRIFPILSDFGGVANGRDVRDAYLKSARGGTTDTPPVKLIEDTLVAMTALSWVDAVGENLYRANKLTQYLGSTPSAIHGILHFTTEVLLSSAFLMRKLEATGFEYPFTGLQTPTQHAYALMGRDDLAGLHTYAIMAAEGRIASFNTFMQGRFGMDAKTPERLQALGYDISSVVQEARGEGSPVKMVDVGGGRGDLLRDIKDAIPGLVEGGLIVAESNADITDIPGLSLANWDYLTEDVPDRIKGALVYHLSGVLHNLPDLGAARLLQKIAGAMERYSRVLIHERCRDEIPAANATMVVLYGGRERSREDWRQLAELAGLKVTFMVFPDGPGQGAVEMRRK